MGGFFFILLNFACNATMSVAIHYSLARYLTVLILYYDKNEAVIKTLI